MLKEENQLLMQTASGTPMGELMRRYWQPVAAAGELDEKRVKPLRLLGEDLVLYKDGQGAYGCLELHCAAARRADLSYGIVEERGLRCNYHGWLYDETGRCIAQPFDDLAHPESNLKAKIRMQAYPVESRGGVLWVYMGPQPAPLVPDWEMFHRDGMVQIVLTEIPCNWVQCQENSIDPVHFEWLHSYWSYELAGREGQPAPPHLKVGFDEFEYGFVYRRIQEGMTEDNPLWTVGRTCLWPNALYTGDHCEWRVPIDDDHTLSVGWFLDVPAPGHELPGGKQYFHWDSPLMDAESGRWINSHTMNQDFIAWVGQGAEADRSKEHLSPSDRGIMMMRQKLFEQMDLVAEGGEPKATFRDPETNHAVQLPNPNTRTGAPPRFNRFPFLYGMPPEIESVFRQVKESWNAEPVPSGR